ncbi:MAG: hypothetical protein WCL16_07300 [bacterium]
MKTETENPETAKNDESLVQLYAEIYGWLNGAKGIGNHDGACEVAEDYRDTGTIPFHGAPGARRQREAVLAALVKNKLIVVSGNTQARQCGLTWVGVCRAVALTVGTVELPKAFGIMRQIADYGNQAGGLEVSPNGAVPEYLLEPDLGTWWKDCKPELQSMMFARAKLFNKLLPALVMRWVHVAIDRPGRRWFSLTPIGRQAALDTPVIPRGLPKDDPLLDFYIEASDAAWEKACAAKPKDTNRLFIGVSASRWWTPKAGAE